MNGSHPNDLTAKNEWNAEKETRNRRKKTIVFTKIYGHTISFYFIFSLWYQKQKKNASAKKVRRKRQQCQRYYHLMLLNPKTKEIVSSFALSSECAWANVYIKSSNLWRSIKIFKRRRSVPFPFTARRWRQRRRRRWWIWLWMTIVVRRSYGRRHSVPQSLFHQLTKFVPCVPSRIAAT